MQNATVGSGSDGVFGVLLGGLFKQVNDSIEQAANQARNVGMELEIEAGQEVSRAIEQVKNAYKEQLDYTVDKVSKEAKIAFDSLSTMVQKFQNGVQQELQEVMTQAQLLADTLPFASKQPQLGSVKPRFLVIDEVTRSALVTFKGNFPWSAKVGFEATLVFSGKPCALVDFSTVTQTFQVPLAAFNKASDDKYSFQTGVLTVPWDDGFIWSHKTEFDYRVGLGSLPLLAGKGTVEYVANDSVRVSEHRKDSFHFDGNSWFRQSWHWIDQKIYPKPDWTIDVSKAPVMTVRNPHGNHQQEILSYSPSLIVLRVGLCCTDGKHMGIVDIDVEFDEYQYDPETKTRVGNFEVNWRDSYLLEPQGNEVISKVTFDDYKGAHNEYGAPENDQRSVLKIDAEGNGKWKIYAEPPQDLSIAVSDLSSGFRAELETAHRLQHLVKLANLPKEIRHPAAKVKVDAPAPATTPVEVETKK